MAELESNLFQSVWVEEYFHQQCSENKVKYTFFVSLNNIGLKNLTVTQTQKLYSFYNED